MRLTAALTGGSLPQVVHPFRSFEPFAVGPFKITPLLTDHSAFDAHMILVEVGGRKILYSGDFRRRGRKSMLVDRMITSPPKDVDVLLLEGTTLGRAEAFPTERDLEERFKTVFQQTPGRVFVSWSAQNIDRTVTIYRACKQSGRTLLVDLYAVDVLEQLGAYYDSLPQMGWPNLRGVVTSGIKRLYETPDRLNRSEFFEQYCTSGHAFGASKIESGPRNSVVMLRPSLLRDYLRKGLVLTEDDCWIFSMWSGYLGEPDFLAVREAFDEADARFEQIHTSGHASRADLQAFASSINAKHLVPIHSFDWDQHVDGFENVTRLRDGEVFEISAQGDLASPRLLNQLEEVEGERHELDDVLVGLGIPVTDHELYGPGEEQGPAAQGDADAALLYDVDVALVVDVGEIEAARGDRPSWNQSNRSRSWVAPLSRGTSANVSRPGLLLGMSEPPSKYWTFATSTMS